MAPRGARSWRTAAALAQHVVDPVAQARQISSLDFIADDVDVAEWVLAVQHPRGDWYPGELSAVREAIADSSWFHDWMRFCVDEAVGGIDGDIVAALRRLALTRTQTHSGKTPSVHAYGARANIEASLRRAASRLSPEQWPTALEALERLSRKSGTFSLRALLDLVEAHVADHPDLLVAFADEQIPVPAPCVTPTTTSPIWSSGWRTAFTRGSEMAKLRMPVGLPPLVTWPRTATTRK